MPKVKRTPRDPIDVIVGRRLKRARRAKRISQTQLADHLGLSFQQIQKYEIASNRMASSRLYRAAAFLGKPVSYFFQGADTLAGQS